MLKRLGIYARAGMALGVILLFMFFVAGVAWYSVAGIGQEVTHIAQRDIPLEDTIARIRNSQSVQKGILFEMLLVRIHGRFIGREGRTMTDEDVQALVTRSRAAFDVEHGKIIERLSQTQQIVRQNMDGLEEGEQVALTTILRGLGEAETTYNTYASSVNQLFAASAEGNLAEAMRLGDGPVRESDMQLQRQLSGIANSVKALIDTSAEHAIASSDAARTTIIVSAIIALVAGLAATYAVARSVIVPLLGAVSVAKRIGGGERDLEIRIDRYDETGQLLEAMKNMLDSINAADREVAEAQNETQKQLDLVQQANVAIQEQAVAINELSTPVIRVWDGILLLPMVGSIDTTRSQQMTERLLDAIVTDNAVVAILDVTGVSTIDTSVARHVMSIVDAAKILGAEVILTGFRPDAAQTLAQLGIDFSSLQTAGALQNGITLAFDKVGMKIS